MEARKGGVVLHLRRTAMNCIKYLRFGGASRILKENTYMKVGITGGIGCGKSTVAGLVGRLGFQLLDSDALIRERVLTTPEVKVQLRKSFGPTVIAKDGSVERAALAAVVFASAEALRLLESLTHPRLFELWREAFASKPAARWAVEVPLLFEKNLENWFDFTVCVACSPSVQLARLELRGLPRALAEQRISQQLPLAQKIEQADFVLWNDGSAEFLRDQIDRLILTLKAVR